MNITVEDVTGTKKALHLKICDLSLPIRKQKKVLKIQFVQIT